MSILLKVIDGPMIGEEFKFDEPDIFLFGRDKECHCCLPNDSFISRHHFLLEVNPPECRLKDLGSLNGTFVNDEKHGGRKRLSPIKLEEAQKAAREIELKNGDMINVGKTRIQVVVEKELLRPVKCVKCSAQIPAHEKDYYIYIGGTYLCRNCREDKSNEQKKTSKSSTDINKNVFGHLRNGKNEKSNDILLDEMIALLFGQNTSGKKAIPQIPGYDFVNELGRGGFGKVYLVKRQRDHKELAMKLMLAKKKEVREKDIALFRQEMSNCMKLCHDNIVAFEEQNYINGIFYFTMEYCGGGPMSRLIAKKGGYLDVDEALPYMFQVLDGLSFIHKNNYVHRDLKPDNILLDKNYKIAKIADLGLAKNFQKTGLSGFTVPINFAGTPHYMPKEQVTDFKNVTPTSDVFSIGATFYRILTGEYVYNFKGVKDPIVAILRERIVPIRERKWMIPKSIADVIDKAISPNYKERYKDAEEMKKALEKSI
ncbi:MAG: FHA domain-containing serine/threonine-protein kinase [Clostridiales bacterium]